jgi:diguanylate cyclase (GGDEF)-like protein
VLAVRQGAALAVVTTASGELALSTGVVGLAADWLPRLQQLKSIEPRLVPTTWLDPKERAAAEGAGFGNLLLCPLALTDRPSGDPLIGVLTIFGEHPVLGDLSVALGILASQVALALERIMLSQEVIRQRGEALFRTLVQDALDVILVLADDGTIMYASPSATRLWGDIPIEGANAGTLTAEHERLSAQPSGTPVAAEAPGPPEAAAAAGPPEADGREEDPYSGLWRINRHDGRELLVEVRHTDLRGDETVRGRVLTVRDVTEQHHLAEELKHQAFHDPLTGLPNRALFADRAAHGIALARRNGTTAAVLFIDLDDFKVINDTMGHAVGDELLAGVGRRLAAVVRKSDTAARLGGDEFALLIENLAEPDAVEAFASRVVAAFSEPFTVSAGSVLATATVGVATTEDSSNVDQLLRHADLSLYAAKSEGKRQWHRYQPVLSASMVKRRELQSALEETVAKSALSVAYQPIVHLASGEVRGFEALARWPDPVRGTVPPSEFIELAEETGLIVPLGSWVLRQAITDLARWRGSDPSPRQPGVSVNVSARQFRDPGFVTHVRRCLDEAGLVPSGLMLELTESSLLHRDERINADLAELKHMGVRLAIDDFGTGYSSLSYLKELPFDILKIDKTFVDAIATSPVGRRFAELIIGFARALGIQVIAEGIETDEQRALLTAMGCEYGQGYLLAMPMDWRSAEKLLRSGRSFDRDGSRRASSWLPGYPVSRLLGDAGGFGARAQRRQQELRREARPHSFPRAQPQVQQRLQAKLGQDRLVDALPAALAGDQGRLHGRLRAHRQQRGHGCHQPVEHHWHPAARRPQRHPRQEHDFRPAERTRRGPGVVHPSSMDKTTPPNSPTHDHLLATHDRRVGCRAKAHRLGRIQFQQRAGQCGGDGRVPDPHLAEANQPGGAF